MRILLIGSGGREHALARTLSDSPSCERLYTSPGNPGTAGCGENVSLHLNDAASLASWLDEHHIDLIVVGPEQPLVEGLREKLEQEGALQHRKFFGPGAAGAQLEGSKEFAKQFMHRNGIPTATYAAFSHEEKDAALDHLRQMRPPYVIKADGLAAGKGVIITEHLHEAEETVSALFSGQLGEAGKRLVLEEFLSGIEFSVFVMTDGERYVELPEAKDYKRIGEGDTGPNTGGMGSVSPVPFYHKSLKEKVRERIIRPTVEGLKREGIPYCGFIFFGLIEVQGDPFVIEYNVRMGDPETQSVLARVKGDLAKCMADLVDGKAVTELETDPRTAVSVVLVSEGYPGKYEKGRKIIGQDGVNKTEGIHVVHAGTRVDDEGELVSSGGRVLALTALRENLAESRAAAYEAMKRIVMEGSAYRRDIGQDLM